MNLAILPRVLRARSPGRIGDENMYRDYAEKIDNKFKEALNVLESVNSGSIYLARSAVELKKSIESAYASFDYMHAMGCWESVASTQKLVNSAIDCLRILQKILGYKYNGPFQEAGRCLYDIQCLLNMIEYNELGVF